MRLFSDLVAAIGDRYFRYAARLAERGRGRTAPNPWVGCVIADAGGTVVGEGFHSRAGDPHAEILALRQAGDRARGATAYVTLEPCAHTGKTPPCAPELVAAGVAEVVVGIPDPNPLARGGARFLRDAGIPVRFADGSDAAALTALLEEWLHATATGRPWITVKTALSLDGRPGMTTGLRADMTGVDGAVITQTLRQAADTILVGETTLASDDPSLTRRSPDGTPDAAQPCRVVLARESMPEPSARIFTDGLGPTAVLAPDTTPASDLKRLASVGAEIALYSQDGGMTSAIGALAGLGAVSVLAETGPRTFTSLWDADLIDALVTVTAGGVAGAQAPSLFRGEQGETDSLPRRMRALEAGVSGAVAAVQWRRAGSKSQEGDR